MNERIENLMYQAGVTASGCWDKMDAYDQEAIEKLSRLIVEACADLVENEGRFLKYDKLADKVRSSFGVK